MRRDRRRVSIRLRLTAWYAGILILVLISLALSFRFVLGRQVRQDVDHQIQATALQVRSQIVLTPDGLLSPQAGLFSFPSLLVQIVDQNGNVKAASETIRNTYLPVSPSTTGTSAPVFGTFVLYDTSVRTVQLPLFVTSTSGSSQYVGYIAVGEPLVQANQTIAHVNRLVIFASLAAVVIAAAAGWFLAGRALRPVDRITAAAAAIASDGGGARLRTTRLDVPPAGDELARLASAFNRMLDRLQETFEGQRRFIADASHELRTPLTAIRGNIDVVARQAESNSLSQNDLDEALVDLRRESQRMNRLVEDLLTLARAEAPVEGASRFAPVALSAVAEDGLRTASTLAAGQTLVNESMNLGSVMGDRDQLVQVLVILLDNAIRHTPSGGEIRVATGIAGDAAFLRVTDSGPGIAKEHLLRLFDRFYRAEPSRHRNSGGTGLGLAIAAAIVEAHHGTIRVASEPGHGAEFTVQLPALKAPTGPI